MPSTSAGRSRPGLEGSGGQYFDERLDALQGTSTRKSRGMLTICCSSMFVVCEHG